MMKQSAASIALALCLTCSASSADDANVFTPEQIRRGTDIYAQNCSPCHGPRLHGEESAFDLRQFPRDQRERFINSVTRGKGQMPPWGGLLSQDDIAALWAYVIAGER